MVLQSMAAQETVLGSLASAVVAQIAADEHDRGRLEHYINESSQRSAAVCEGVADGLPHAPGPAPEARVPLETYLRLWEVARERARHNTLGLQLAEQQSSGTPWGVLGATARHSRSLGEAIGYAVRYSRVLNEAGDVTLAIEGEAARLRDGPQDRRCMWSRQAAELQLASYVLWGRSWTGVDWAPLSVSFQHAAPIDIREHRRVFRCPIQFRQPRNEIRFPARVLELPILGRSQLAFDESRRRAEAALDWQLRRDTLVTQVRRFVRRQAGGPDPSVEDAARALGLSTRTLQRRLSELDSSYTTVVDDVRRRTALELLRLRYLSVAEIAKRLGFSDAKAFRRAFRRWTGSSPRQYRAA